MTPDFDAVKDTCPDLAMIAFRNPINADVRELLEYVKRLEEAFESSENSAWEQDMGDDL